MCELNMKYKFLKYKCTEKNIMQFINSFFSHKNLNLACMMLQYIVGIGLNLPCDVKKVRFNYR